MLKAKSPCFLAFCARFPCPHPQGKIYHSKVLLLFAFGLSPRQTFDMAAFNCRKTPAVPAR